MEKEKRERRGLYSISYCLIRIALFSKKTQEKEEAAIKDGIHNSNLWEARLNVMELSG